MPGTPCASPFTLDALLNLDGGVKPETVTTDNSCSECHQSRNENVARLSPSKHKNFNVLGRYSLIATQLAGSSRCPLRDPDAAVLDDDEEA
ncbi:hypothetical protein PUR34_04935 [Streptomyces sp. JV185]|nr:hypothetical protein [Streptomyces sp. JV185]MEE1767541.1 hypothetical protein [Streptomyces sp. JV185]